MSTKLNKCDYLIYKELPRYIHVWLIIITVLLILVIFICCNYKYNKFYEINGLVIKEETGEYVQVLFEYDKLDFITNGNLVLNGEDKDYEYKVGSNFYSEKGTVYKEVKLYFNHHFEVGEIINLNFRTSKTTIMKEIKNKIKKGMM